MAELRQGLFFWDWFDALSAKLWLPRKDAVNFTSLLPKMMLPESIRSQFREIVSDFVILVNGDKL
jgi:hypothetical protein